MALNSNIPKKQRALVLQGEGALGAYEVGVLKTMCKKLTDNYKGNDERDGLLFDIVAGTSIGAMNTAVLVINVVNWKRLGKKQLTSLKNSGQKRETVYLRLLTIANGGGGMTKKRKNI